MIKLDGFQYADHEIAGVTLEVAERGEGRAVLYLPSSQGIWGAGAFLGQLANSARVIVPTHPGFGYTDMPGSISLLEDYVYLYLDLLDRLNLDDVVLIGSSFGGWIAAEMAIRDRRKTGGLVLIDTLGFKFSGRESRDITDMHGIPGKTMAPLLYSDPDRYAPKYGGFDDEELLRAARAWESFTFIGWQPYMHNPKLHTRLHRITMPTLLVWGGRDGIVTTEYGRTIAAAIPDARMEIVEGAGHFPYIEQPDATAGHIQRFIGATRS